MDAIVQSIFRNRVRMLIAAGFASLGVGVNAQFINGTQPIEVEADSTGADARSGALIFSNISIRQGQLNISAQQAESSALGFDDSMWTFSGNVILSSPEAELRAQSLVLRFANRQLEAARLRGAPFHFRSTATDNTDVTAASANVSFANNEITTIVLSGQPIEVRRLNPGTGKITRARADAISYDAKSRKLELLGNAELNEDDNIITGNQITYDLGGQTVLAAGDEEGNDRVHITIRPRGENGAGGSPAVQPDPESDEPDDSPLQPLN